MVKRVSSRCVRISRWERRPHRDNVFRAKARIDGFQTQEGLDHELGANQEHQGQRHLRNHQSAPQPPVRASGADLPPVCFKPWFRSSFDARSAGERPNTSAVESARTTENNRTGAESSSGAEAAIPAGTSLARMPRLSL